MKATYCIKILQIRALLTLLLAVCVSGVWCRCAAADEDALYSNPSHISTLNWHEGDGPIGDPPPASGGGDQGGGDVHGGGGEDPVDPGGSTGSNETPPCENQSGGGFTSILFFVARFLSPCP